MLTAIGDDQIAAATADFLFRIGDGRLNIKQFQGAINKAFPRWNMIKPQGTLGSQTIRKLREVAKDPSRKRLFLDNLAYIRDQIKPRETERNNYFRYTDE